MKLGIVGNGKIVQEFCSIKNNFEFEYISICGRKKSQESICKLKEQYHLDACFFDYEEFLKSAIDTVYIAVVNSLHFEYAKQALEYGKNVIIEKPMTLHFSEALELYTIAREKELFIWEAMTIPYLPAYIDLKETLKQNSGIKMAAFEFCQRSSRYDAFLRGEVLPAFDPKLGGGALTDLNVYNVYAAVDLFGVPNQAVYHRVLEKNVDVNGTLVLEYSDFQVICIAAKDSASPCQSVIQCENSTYVISEPINQMHTYDYIKSQETHTWTEQQPQHRMVYEFQNFLKAQGKDDLQTCYQRMEKSLEVIKILEQVMRK